MLGLTSLFKVFYALEEARDHLASAASRPEAQAAAPTPEAAPTPASAASFPLRAECLGCKVVLEFPQAGHYRCPHCRGVYSVDAAGRIAGSKPRAGQPVELTLTCQPDSIRAFQSFVGALPSWPGYTEDERAQLESVVAELCAAIHQKAYGGDPNGSFHVLAVSRQGEIALRVADHGGPLEPADFPLAADYMSEFELRPHPARGNLLKMTRRAD
jgi:anti-sigma regulatory factor (Ser/Thr protein kinase)